MKALRTRRVGAVCVLVSLIGASAAAQTESPGTTANAGAVVVPSVPGDYVIGADDQLSIVFFQNSDMSGDVVVRPDGKISLPLLNDVEARGLTPEQLRARLDNDARRFMQTPNATVIVKQINSRRVSIVGAVERPGSYPLLSRMTLLEFIASVGGLKDYAAQSKITVRRQEGDRRVTMKYNYRQVINGTGGAQDIELKPGDIVVVP